MPPPLTQGRLSFGLDFSSPDLFVALLGFAAPPVELGVYLDYQQKHPERQTPFGVHSFSLHGSTRIFLSENIQMFYAKWYPLCRSQGYFSRVPSLCMPISKRTCLCGPPLYFLLSAERGFTISLQSRSPLSSAVIITSAVAIFVATGTLYTSHIRSNS